ncbi:MAG TPA: tol-pal system protein YbgF [Gemmatimonadaceae bacterium]|nr:tol-pal system protein YbgF [Gemmatimonadaceae bacterium]
MIRGVRCLLPLVLLATGACFATREDVQALHADVQSLRADNARSDSARRAALDRVVTSMNIVRDSLGLLSARVFKMQGDVRGDLYNVGQQLLQIQQLTGQSQQRVQELRAALEARQSDMQSSNAQPGAPAPGAAGTAAVPPTSTGATTPSSANPSTRPGATTTPAPAGGATPGPNQLFQISLEQLRRGSPGAARTGLQTLLQQYPTSDLVPDAEFYLGEAYHQEGNAAGADSAYAAVVSNYPTSPRAPTALYKRALGMEEKGNVVGARGLLNDLVTRYPRSDEAALAKERLRTLK